MVWLPQANGDCKKIKTQSLMMEDLVWGKEKDGQL